MESVTQVITYQGNSTISLETLSEYPHPVVVKKPSKPHAPQRAILALDKEYEMTRTLDGVEGVRKALS